MLTTAKIELIGYAGKDPIFPKPNEYPNFVTFSVGVSRTWKDKEVNINHINLLTSSKEKQSKGEISRENYITEIEELSKLNDEIPF